jgi:hypothetical protein
MVTKPAPNAPNCYDYDVPVFVLFLPCTPIRVETVCFVRIFKTIKNHLSMIRYRVYLHVTLLGGGRRLAVTVTSLAGGQRGP